MTSALHCPNCGSEMSGDSTTCHACGQSVDTEAKYEQEMMETSNRYIGIALAVVAVLIAIALLF